MPELPEVETIRTDLSERLIGRSITQVLGAGGRLVRNNPQGVEDLRAELTNATISALDRRGKFMWMNLADSDNVLVIHLGMSGQVRVRKRVAADLAKHEHVRLLLGDGQKVSFVDPRTFGHLTISPLIEDQTGRHVPEIASRIAPDPLEVVDYSVWTDRIRRTRRNIKAVLLDQAVISGIGNIYADEALFRASISGYTPGTDLDDSEIHAIIDAARDVIIEALARRGTSFDSAYVDTRGKSGSFSGSLNVYKKAGRQCARCGERIRRTVISGRSHFYCPTCQSLPIDREDVTEAT